MKTIVFKIVGDMEPGKAIKDGIESSTALARDKLKALQNELDDLKAREAIKEAREALYWQEKILDAYEEYAINEPLTGLRERLLQAYGLICLGVDTAFKKLQAINRES